MANPEYKDVERVFALLILLNNHEGLTREEIYEQVAGYNVSEIASARMFERDIACLKRLGFNVLIKRTNGPALYWIIQAEDMFIVV